MENVSSSLVLFCKRPRPGVSKTRLAAGIGEVQAFRVAEALHRCALEDLQMWQGSVVIAPATPEDLEWAQRNLSRGIEVVSQPQGNLGERLQEIDQELRDRRYERQIIIGSDMPEMTQAILQQADELLFQYDVVLSSASDGGVALMASRCPWPPLADLPWSTPQLGQSLADCCRQHGLSVGWADDCDDVDIIEDLFRLRDNLKTDDRAARQRLYHLVVELLEEY